MGLVGLWVIFKFGSIVGGLVFWVLKDVGWGYVLVMLYWLLEIVVCSGVCFL